MVATRGGGTAAPMVYNAVDQLTLWPGMYSYTYYGDGSMKEVKNPAGTVLRSYTYTPDGLLSSATYAGRISTFTWDADKNRVGMNMNGGNYSFVYDTTAGIPAVIEEVTPGGSIFYIREPGGELLARVDEDENIRYYHFDELGSTRILTDGTGDAESNPNFGKVTDRYVYDAYGNTLSHTGSTDQPYQYVGRLGYYTHHQDPEFHLMQLGVRFYDPQTGRFTQRDTAREGLSLYPYVNNETLSFVDPTGMFMDPGAMYICDRLGDALACVQKWRDWWLRNHPWDKKHPPKYGPHMDKVGHCFVTCKAIKDCGLRRGAALAIGQGKEWIVDVIGKGGSDADDQAANELGADIAEKAGSNCLPDCIKAVQKKYGGIPRRYLGL